MTKEKRDFYIVLAIFVVTITVLIGIFGSMTNDYEYEDSSYDSDYSSSYTSSYSSSFTNDYGTSSTICAHSGCTRTIASSGDTNCCIIHSNDCGNCGCYIDEDAMYCMDCLREALS